MKKIHTLTTALIFGTVYLFGQTATVTVNPSTVIMPDPKLLLGITYDCRSSLSNQTGMLMGYHNTDATFNPAVDAVFANFPMTTLRYPANGILQGFEWKKSIGPISGRTPQQVFAQSQIPAQVMEFGFDEFMAMTAARGVDPKDVQIMVPIYDSATVYTQQMQTDGSIPNCLQSNADWVEYANAPNDGSNPGGGIDWAAIRAANGRPSPYGIKIWNMGNEPYVSGEFGTGAAAANNYINTIIPMIDAMLLIDPTIKISVTVTQGLNAWTNTILNSSLLQGKIYALNVHFFLTEEVIGGNLPYGVAGASTNLSALSASAQSKGYKVIVGDNAHAILTQNPVDMDLAMQWQGANLSADFLLAMSQTNNVERANFWVYGLWTNAWHPIRKNNNGTFTSMPAAEMYKILNPVFLDNSVHTTTSSPAASDGNPYSVRCGAFISSDNSQLNVVGVNRDKNNTIPLQVNGVTGYTLVNPRLLTATALNSDTIVETIATTDGFGNYILPPMSVIILEYTNTTTSINQVNSANETVFLSPNPFSRETTLRTTTQLRNATVSVDNVFGQTVAQIKNISGQTVTLQRNALPTGLYFVRLTEDNKLIATKKIIIAD